MELQKRKPGRKPVLTQEQVGELLRLYKSGNLKIKELAALFEVHEMTIYGYLRRAREKGGAQ